MEGHFYSPRELRAVFLVGNRELCFLVHLERQEVCMPLARVPPWCRRPDETFLLRPTLSSGTRAHERVKCRHVEVGGDDSGATTSDHQGRH